MKNRMYLIVAALLFACNIQAQEVVGRWKTIDDETGKEKSIVEIFMKDGKLYGKIEKLLNREPGDENPLCEACKDDRKGQHVVGMEIIRDMEADGEEWNSGTIMDPKNGKVYECKLWIDEDDPNILKVRGYIAFLYRTQVWHRIQ